MSSTDEIAIIGAGLFPFGRHEGVTGLEMGVSAARAALSDAGLAWEDMEFAFGGSEDAGRADTIVADLGQTGLPFTNVSNGCATGGSALVSAVRSLQAGAYDVGLVVGFDKHARGAFRPDPAEWGLPEWYGELGMMLTTQFFGAKLQRYISDYEIPRSTLSEIAAKAYRHAALTPHAWRKTTFSAEQIANSDVLADPLTKYMFCSPSEGGAAVVVCRGDYLAKLENARPIWLRSVAFRTRLPGSFEVFSPSLGLDITPSPTVDAARLAFETAGVAPSDVDVAQLQDTESGAELMHLAECGLCEHGEQAPLIDRGDTEIGGRIPINTDGGCLGNGEPVGASGLRQVCEVVTQLRGEGGDRQVPDGPKVGFTHVYGAPGVSACTVMTV
jgi:acetyl-CoA acetyltransferase